MHDFFLSKVIFKAQKKVRFFFILFMVFVKYVRHRHTAFHEKSTTVNIDEFMLSVKTSEKPFQQA